MSKVIKLKQSDIEGIVSSLISEQQEEQQEEQNQLNPTKEGLIIGQDQKTGKYYIINGETGDIIDVN